MGGASTAAGRIWQLQDPGTISVFAKGFADSLLDETGYLWIVRRREFVMISVPVGFATTTAAPCLAPLSPQAVDDLEDRSHRLHGVEVNVLSQALLHLIWMPPDTLDL
jgi:hypothetical protein